MAGSSCLQGTQVSGHSEPVELFLHLFFKEIQGTRAPQQTPFITSAAPGVQLSEADNAPYLSLESGAGEAGSVALL